jgi:hypothetical protein
MPHLHVQTLMPFMNVLCLHVPTVTCMPRQTLQTPITDIIPLICRTNNTKRRVARAGFLRIPRESQGQRYEDYKQNILILSAEKMD